MKLPQFFFSSDAASMWFAVTNAVEFGLRSNTKNNKLAKWYITTLKWKKIVHTTGTTHPNQCKILIKVSGRSRILIGGKSWHLIVCAQIELMNHLNIVLRDALLE